MTLFQAIVLGIIQGLSEFLPISSSAHLALTPWLLHWPEPGLSFDVALHTGTLVAVLAYFRAEWMRLLRAAWDIVTTRKVASESQRRVVLLVIATIPERTTSVRVSPTAGRSLTRTLLSETR